MGYCSGKLTLVSLATTCHMVNEKNLITALNSCEIPQATTVLRVVL